MKKALGNSSANIKLRHMERWGIGRKPTGALTEESIYRKAVSILQQWKACQVHTEEDGQFVSAYVEECNPKTLNYLRDKLGNAMADLLSDDFSVDLVPYTSPHGKGSEIRFKLMNREQDHGHRDRLKFLFWDDEKFSQITSYLAMHCSGFPPFIYSEELSTPPAEALEEAPLSLHSYSHSVLAQWKKGGDWSYEGEKISLTAWLPDDAHPKLHAIANTLAHTIASLLGRDVGVSLKHPVLDKKGSPHCQVSLIMDSSTPKACRDEILTLLSSQNVGAYLEKTLEAFCKGGAELSMMQH